MNSRRVLPVVGAVSILLASAASAAPALSPDVARKVFEDDAPKTCVLKWSNVQIAPMRRASPGESREVGLPLNQPVYPVRAEYTQICHPGFIRDYRQTHLFYKDDFGKWAKQVIAVSDNYVSDAR